MIQDSGKDRLRLLAFISVTILFWASLVYQRRGVADAWILKDLEWVTLGYVAVFAILVTRIRSPALLVLISSIFVWTFSSIPGVKYALPYGFSDEASHYNLVSTLLATGTMPAGSPYTNVPGFHIAFAINSLVMGLALPEIFRFWLPLLYVSVPGIVYFGAKRMTGDVRSIKMAVIAASLLTLIGYRVNPLIFVLPLFVLYLVVLYLRAFRPGNYGLQLEIILLLVTIFLVATHSFTALILISATIGVAIWMAVRKGWSRPTGPNSVRLRTLSMQLLMAATIFVAWWALIAQFVLSVFVTTLYDYIVLDFAAKPFVPVKLASLSLGDQLSVFVLFHVRDVLVFGLLLFTAVLLWARKGNGGKVDGGLIAFFGGAISVLYAMIIFQYVLNFGSVEYARFLVYIASLFPLFLMIRAISTPRPKGRRILWRQAVTLGIVAFVGISVLQVFPYQPLAPRADLHSAAPPLEDYLFYVNEVNSVYQVRAIRFLSAPGACNQAVASDIVARNQIRIFGSSCLQDNHLYSSPLLSENEVEWDFFMLHWPGRAGPLSEPMEFRDGGVMERLVHGSNIVYTNGESFVLGAGGFST